MKIFSDVPTNVPAEVADVLARIEEVVNANYDDLKKVPGQFQLTVKKMSSTFSDKEDWTICPVRPCDDHTNTSYCWCEIGAYAWLYCDNGLIATGYAIAVESADEVVEHWLYYYQGI